MLGIAIPAPETTGSFTLLTQQCRGDSVAGAVRQTGIREASPPTPARQGPAFGIDRGVEKGSNGWGAEPSVNRQKRTDLFL